MPAIRELTSARMPRRSSTLILSRTTYGDDVAALVPLDLDAALRVVHEVEHVRAGRGVHRHALAARDVADDLLAADRVAAARAEDQQVVDAAHLDLLLAAGAEHALDDARDGAVGRLLAQRHPAPTMPRDHGLAP